MTKGKGEDRVFRAERKFAASAKALGLEERVATGEKGWRALSEERRKESEGCRFGWRLWVLE